MVQGAAAEFFKTWAAIVRARCMPIDARIVLCLHDELLVHSPAHLAEAAAAIVADGVQEASHRWSGGATASIDRRDIDRGPLRGRHERDRPLVRREVIPSRRALSDRTASSALGWRQ